MLEHEKVIVVVVVGVVVIFILQLFHWLQRFKRTPTQIEHTSINANNRVISVRITPSSQPHEIHIYPRQFSQSPPSYFHTNIDTDTSIQPPTYENFILIGKNKH